MSEEAAPQALVEFAGSSGDSAPDSGEADEETLASRIPRVDRTTEQITLESEHTESAFGATWALDFFINDAYSCGDGDGRYTFLVMNPAGTPDAEAPLWVYLHGGGVGYYDGNRRYETFPEWLDETSWNAQEDYVDLWDGQLRRRTVDEANHPIDQTLARRIAEGYRVLAVSMCDHDLYSGVGTPYPNNPHDDEVNGLQATMAAIDFTTANYPTTYVFAHGTSAGSTGAWSTALAYAGEGTYLTAIVSDSIITPRFQTIHQALSGAAPWFAGDFGPEGAAYKVGVYLDLERELHATAVISAGFIAVPSLFIGGGVDPQCGGDQPPITEAIAAGRNNCDWMFDELVAAVEAQPNSPHQVAVFDGERHIPTNYAPSPAHEAVDAFITRVLATAPAFPFATTE